jgi:hypothetical protein
MKAIRVLTISIVLACMLLMNLSTPRALASPNPAVLPPKASVQGLTLGEWLAKLQQLFAIPEPFNPIFHPIPECYFVRYGNVGIAPTYFDNGLSSCTMPAGMMLHVNVIVYVCLSAMGDGDTKEELHACAESLTMDNLQAYIDGIPIVDIDSYAATSPVFTLDFTEDNIFGLPAGPSLGVAHGYAFITTPLSPGVHTIHVHGEAPDYPFVYDRTYNITVTP